MLKALTIENIAVAKSLDVEFPCGFTAVTGKTGAGKSVMIDALYLLTGAKAQRELIRSGENSASVSAIFQCEGQLCDELREIGYPPDENGELEITRTLSADGRSGAKINRRSVPLAALRECTARLLAIHGQNDNLALYDKKEAQRILDAYADDASEFSEYTQVYAELVKKRGEIADLKKTLKDREMMVDILKYQVSEIDKARLRDPTEEEKLEKLRIKLKGIERISKSASLIYRALAPGDKGASASYLLERAEAALRQLDDVLDGAAEMADRLYDYRLDIEDIAERARDVIDDDDMRDPDAQLDRIETRLSQISRLEKKYGPTIEDVTAFRDEAARKLADLENGDARISELESEYKAVAKRAAQAAGRLSEKRVDAAKRLSAEVMETVRFLDMPKVSFRAAVKPGSAEHPEFTPTGTDDIDFTVVMNPGETPKSLSKTASGGEMSRIMLALKCAEAEKSGAGCVIFDEIDTGVSGGTSEKIGIKLAQLSRDAQVICVTHSAQVSAHADHHLLVEKSEIDGRSESCIRELDHEERVQELARIIGGIELTEKQYGAARQLLSNSVNNK